MRGADLGGRQSRWAEHLHFLARAMLQVHAGAPALGTTLALRGFPGQNRLHWEFGPQSLRLPLFPGQPELAPPSPDTCLFNPRLVSLLSLRFAQEYKKEPDRGYGAGVITVFKKLLSPKCRDVFEPARAQFHGKGSYGNGGAMRVAGISLAYSSVQDVQKVVQAGQLLGAPLPPSSLQPGFCDSPSLLPLPLP